jgi:hypothetical protein
MAKSTNEPIVLDSEARDLLERMQHAFDTQADLQAMSESELIALGLLALRAIMELPPTLPSAMAIRRTFEQFETYKFKRDRTAGNVE